MARFRGFTQPIVVCVAVAIGSGITIKMLHSMLSTIRIVTADR